MSDRELWVSARQSVGGRRRTGPSGGAGPAGALRHGAPRRGYPDAATPGRDRRRLRRADHRGRPGPSRPPGRVRRVGPGQGGQLSQGREPIVEDGLEELVREGLAAGRLRFVLGATRSGRGRRVRLPVRPHPPGRRRVGRRDASSRRWPRDRAGPPARGGDRATSRPCRWARPCWSSGSSTAPTSRSCRTRSSCARARPSTTASIPTGSWSAPTTGRPRPGWARCSPRPRRRH